MATLKDAIAEGDVDPDEMPAVQIKGNVEINGVKIDPTTLQNAASMGSHTRLTCKFCSSMYLLTVSRSNCPNCGAPASD
jgi:hypothetical protein